MKAFVGLELVAIELDDPFGDDPNDFDVAGLANVTFKDIYIFIYDLQGDTESKALLDFLREINKKGKSLNNEVGNLGDKKQSEGNKHNKGGHKRLPSHIAWSYSVHDTERREAGSETSKLLLNEQNREVDQLEANQNRTGSLEFMRSKLNHQQINCGEDSKEFSYGSISPSAYNGIFG